MTAPGLVASEADRAALAEVLASPDFQAQRWRGDDLRRWLAGWWERLTELLGTSEAERWADLGRVVFLAAVAVALLLAWRAARRRTAPRTSPRRGAPERTTIPRAERLTAAAAEQALAAGDRAAAVRLAFLAAVDAIRRRLRRGAIADTLTGRELAAGLGDEGFSRLARLHERTVFGRRPVTLEEAATALAVAVRLVAAPADEGQANRPGVAR